MPEYIERDALVKRIADEQAENHVGCGNAGYKIGYHNGLSMARAMVLNAPAADVVEVVRCKDCKRCLRDDVWGGRWCIRGVGLIQVSPDAFCSYGERIFTDSEVTREDEYIPEDIWEEV